MLISHLLGLAIAANAGAPSALTIENCDFGEVMAFATAKCVVELSNSGDKIIRVSAIKAVKEGVTAHADAVVVPPHAKAYLDTSVDVGNAIGAVSYAFRLDTNEAGHPERSVRGSGFVLTTLDQARPEVDLGVVDLAAVARSKKAITLSSHEIPAFRITRILEKPDWLDAEIASDGAELAVNARTDASLGLHDGFVKLEINTPPQKQVWISVKADIHGDVVPSANPLDMGLMRFGNRNEQMIRLNERSGRDFGVGKLELEGIKGTLKQMPCEPVAKGCRMIRLTVSDQQPSGTLKGRIWVDLPGLHQRLPISVWGWIVAKDFNIGKLQPDAPQSTGEHGAEAGPMSPAASAPNSLQAALKGVAAEEQATGQPAPPGTSPLLKWTITNGNEVHGFQIFRATSETGPYLILNPAPVAAVKQAASYTYQWRDNAAERGKTYWYYIGMIKLDGSKQQLSGPQKVVAK